MYVVEIQLMHLHSSTNDNKIMINDYAESIQLKKLN